MRAPPFSRLSLLLLLLPLLVATSSDAATPPPSPRSKGEGARSAPSVAAATAKTAEIPQLHIDVQKATLPNGLRIVLSVDHTSPTVAVDVMYDVGARNEERGHSGFAHLFEHMMFQGSANVPKGEHMKLVSSHGGTLNANTGSDRTNPGLRPPTTGCR